MTKAIMEQIKIFCEKDIKSDAWLWCKHCRCYRASELKKLMSNGKIFLFYHQEDSNGDVRLDSRPLDELIRDNPELPETPVKEWFVA